MTPAISLSNWTQLFKRAGPLLLRTSLNKGTIRMIITSLLDTELFKFTMMQAVLHQFPGAQVAYTFECRHSGAQLAAYAQEIRDEIHALCQLQFQPAELQYLRSLRFIKSDFIDFLQLFKLNEKYIQVTVLPDGQIDIKIKGPWLHVILFETPLLAIINEVYFRNTELQPNFVDGRQRLDAKIQLLRMEAHDGLKIADYGTSQRFSRAWHEEVLRVLCAQMGASNKPALKGHAYGQFVGTSNVFFAMRLGIKPLGSMAPEFMQACQALGPRLRDSQVFAFESWAKEYRGDLGIALSDVYGLDAFLCDFDLYFCKLFDGARHDSGDPFVWGERLLLHYSKNRVNPLSKTLIFSGGLTVPRAIELYRQFHGRCQLAFGIDSHLTNDLGYEPLQLALNLTHCNDQPVAGLCSLSGQSVCADKKYLAYLRQVFKVSQEQFE